MLSQRLFIGFFLAFLISPFFGQSAWGTAISSAGTGNWGVASTWSPAQVPTNSDDVTIQNGNTVTVDTNSGSICYARSLTINGSIANYLNAADNLYLYGNLTNNNGSSGFASGGTAHATTIQFKSNAIWTGAGDISGGKFQVTVNSGVTLDISGTTAGIKMPASGTLAFIVNGTLITGTGGINGNANKTGTFILGPTGTLATANVNGITNGIGILGTITNFVSTGSTNGMTLPTTANYVFNGTSTQITAGLPTNVNSLTISNASGVTLSAACTATNLVLSSGQLTTTAANLLTIAVGGSISGGSSGAFVSGPLAQIYSTTGSEIFPIGLNNNYRAVTLNMTALSGTPTVIITPHEPSTWNTANTPQNITMFTNRDWTLSNSVSSGNICTLTVDGTGYSPSGTGVLVDYNGATSNSFAATFTSPNYTAAGVNLTGSSDFALGDCAPPASAPTNIVVSAPGCSPVSVKWNSVSSAASYNIYRKLSVGLYGTVIGNSVTTNYSDPTAINGSNYVYAITAVSACSGESARSADSSPVTPSSGAYIITSPVSVTTGYNYTPTFSVTAINTTSNQWFLLTNGGSVWKKVINGTGGTNTSYTTVFTTTNMSGNQYECVSYGCSGAVTSAPAILTILPYDQYDILRLTWQSNLISSGSSLTSVANTASNYWTGNKPINTSPSVSSFYLWSDLPLGSVSANISSTYKRLQAMALAWATPGCSLQNNSGLAAAVGSGLDWMNTNVYSTNVTASGDYDNWFDWEVTTPQAFDNTAVLLYSYLDSTQISNYCTTLDHFAPDGPVFGNTGYNWQFLTGANTASAVTVVVIRGILGKSNTRLTIGQTNLSSVFPYDSGPATASDGFWTDGSFTFHFGVAYNGHYGYVLLGNVATVVNLLQGSTWAITDPNLSNVYSWILNSFEPLMYNGAMMDMVRGRFIGQSSDEFGDGATILSDIQQVAQFAPTATATALNAFVSSPLLPPGQFHFYNMDRVVALRNGFGFGLSMSSSRIDNYENETVIYSAESNLKGWFTGDGMTYLYLGTMDTQFTGDCWATIDWYHLPGTTSETNATPQPGTTDQNWVGGAQVGNTYGVAGLSQHANNTTLNSKKSYFMLDNEIVCLGAGITCSDANRIETTVENRRLGTSPTNNFWVNGVQIPPTIDWSSNLTTTSWCALDGVGGYYFPGGATNLFAAFVTNSGTWTAIHPTDSDSSIHTDGYLELYFKHGAKPTNATYAYVLLPNMSASVVSNYALSPDIIVLTNTPTVQAVSKPSLGVVAANFWTNGNNTIDIISSSNQASIITWQSINVLSVGISDPTQTNKGPIRVTLNRIAASILFTNSGVSVLQTNPTIIMSVNVNGSQGATYQASFSLGGSSSSPSITNQPASLTVNLGSNATFTVGASGTAPLNYQWFFNVTNAVGMNTNILTLANAQGANAGAYMVVVTNVSGSVTSTPAVLTVNFLPSLTAQFLTGNLQLNLNGMLSSNFTIQYSTNLATTNWITLLTLSNLLEIPYAFADTNGMISPARFYRARMQ